MNNPLRSEKLDQFMPAFLEAQSVLDPVEKNAENTHLHTRYADLAAVRKACLPPLNGNNIAVIQLIVPVIGEPPIFFETTKMRGGQAYNVLTQVLGILRTELIHTSGQFIASEIPLACAWGDAQSLGGTISYLRRYALATICGLVQADDDGHSAKGGHQDSQRPRQRPAPPPRRQESYQADDRFDEFDDSLRPGDKGYQDRHQTQRRRDDRSERKAEYNRAFSRPQPAPVSSARLPDFGKRGFYGWIQAADVNDPDRATATWFKDYGQRNDFPPQFIHWNEPQILTAYTAYQAVPLPGNGQH